MQFKIGPTIITHLDTKTKHLGMIIRVSGAFSPEINHRNIQNTLSGVTKYLIDEGFINDDGKKDWVTDVMVLHV